MLDAAAYPCRRVVTKGLLSFARNVLFFEIAGAIKLVHFMVLVSGLMLLGESRSNMYTTTAVGNEPFLPSTLAFGASSGRSAHTTDATSNASLQT